MQILLANAKIMFDKADRTAYHQSANLVEKWRYNRPSGCF